MLVSVLGKNWRKVYVVAFTVYIDDSGTAREQKVANATVLIIPAEKILDMEKELDALKKKEGFTDFHTSVFIARNPKFEFAGWSDSKQKRVLRRMRQITRKYTSQIFSLAVNKADFDSIMPTEIRKHTGDHFAWAMRHMLPFAQLWRSPIPNIPPYEWVFDHMEKHEPSRKQLEEIMDQAEEDSQTKRGVRGDFTNYHFRSRKLVAGLQCADLAAWTNYQFSLKVYSNKPLHPLARIVWDDFASMPSSNPPGFPEPLDWNYSIAIKADHLKSWVQKELADGKSLAAFREWDARKRAEKRAALSR
jgi:Protein of unknown function (DUF3800)